MDGQDLPEPQVKECDIDSSRPADFAGLELQDPHTSKNEKKNIQLREKEVSLSDKLDEISGNCELDLVSSEVAGVFCDAVQKPLQGTMRFPLFDSDGAGNFYNGWRSPFC